METEARKRWLNERFGPNLLEAVIEELESVKKELRAHTSTAFDKDKELAKYADKVEALDALLVKNGGSR